MHVRGLIEDNPRNLTRGAVKREKRRSMLEDNTVGFEPQILAFACHYCAYAAADLAGSMRLSYPTNVKIVQLPCTGKIDVLYLLKAFERGADGVLVAG
jgi:F420-non-reducing hydrogenase iron-sulfur subunit